MTRILFAALALAAGLAQPAAAADCRFTLNFTHGSSRIHLADEQLLDEIARRYPQARIRLSAHADDDGTPAQNARIAEARARSVAARLVRAGMKAEALSLAADWDVVPSRGWSAPLNRRVELFVIGCNPANHIEDRPMRAPGEALAGRRVMLTSPRLP